MHSKGRPIIIGKSVRRTFDMSETMHIENMFVNHAKIKDKALTWVEYT